MAELEEGSREKGKKGAWEDKDVWLGRLPVSHEFKEGFETLNQKEQDYTVKHLRDSVGIEFIAGLIFTFIIMTWSLFMDAKAFKKKETFPRSGHFYRLFCAFCSLLHRFLLKGGLWASRVAHFSKKNLFEKTF